MRIESFNLISTGAEGFIRRHVGLDLVWGLIWGPSALPAKSCYKIKVVRVYLAEGEEPGSNLLQNNPRVEGVVLPPIPPRDYGTKAPCKETCYGPPTAP